MRQWMTISAVALAAGAALVAAPAAVRADDLASLRVLADQYPRAFFFRSAEGFAANPRMSYDRWEASFSRLMGIQGKCLDEEVPGRSVRNVDSFTRFKKQHPDQLVLLHYNGNARDPRFEIDEFFAGHFLYFNGAKILDDVPAEPGETEIRVDDPALFRTEIGRYRWSNDDVGLCELDADGKPDWHKSEQVQLVSVDRARKVIRVKRGCYGAEPLAFKAGTAYAAAHVTEGPWGGKSNLLWFYNYSAACPRDRNGRTCTDVYCEELARRFLPGGELAAFDGLEFDVMHHELGAQRGPLGIDCDADGRADSGLIDGLNVYGQGVVEFCRRLREKLGPNRLILADGMSPRNQRAFGILNGIESEGWPTLSDWEIGDWSGGLNRHFFWQTHGRAPVFNYINHKFTTAGDTPGSRQTPEVPFRVHRLVFAAAMFTDSAVCYSFPPPKPEGELIGVWDELRKGTENQLGWLGRPLGPAVRLAEKQPDLLEGRGAPVRPELAQRFEGKDATISVEDGALRVSASSEEADSLRFTLRGVSCDGPDLFVSVTAQGEPPKGFPREVARLMWVGIASPEARLVRAEPPVTGMCLRGGEETDLDRETGASVQFLAGRDLGGEKHDGYLVHPPYKGTARTAGYTFWEREVDVPRDGSLEFFTGMGEKSPERSDGVVFRVLVAQAGGAKAPQYQPIFEHTQKAFEWVPHRVSLADWAGRRVRLKFTSDCGPNDNCTTDHSHWGDVWVVGPEGREAFTEPVRYMTWLGDRPFTSGFSFHNVRSKNVDLEWIVEGREPISISAIRVHAHPDVIYREFEHGLVLANPSPRPYEFDLAHLLPNRNLRRLHGSPEQDPTANNGTPVGGKITLEPKEGLFLVKED
ncbi:MAG TPA: hypothetical protein VMY37_30665 [Thermoguttaceae bacterium]|nr:hypothetical protein [Thermoguttaceae bacterium]